MLNKEIFSKEYLLKEINFYLKKLFPLTRSIAGPQNRDSLEIIREIIPIKIGEIPSGQKVFDWEVPKEWIIKDASITDGKGRKIVDLSENNLHVVNYSISVNKNLFFEELKNNLHIHESIPSAIPYRTSYYKKTWGFCITHRQYKELEETKGPFKVFIDSKHVKGSLSYGELIIPGNSKKEILLSAYICHPSMANDSLSGVITLAFLAKFLLNQKNLNWTYRIIFVPETIGAITYCHRNKDIMNLISSALVFTTCGGPGKFGFKESWDNNHYINRLIEEVFKTEKIEYKKYPFDIHGSDERQFSSLGFRINTSSITKDKYYEYDYYHSSLDDLNFVSAENLYKTFNIYKKLFYKLEKVKIYRNLNPHCEIMLSKHDLYPSLGGTINPKSNNNESLEIILWLLFYCDGVKDINSIANLINKDPILLDEIASYLVSKKLLEIY